VAGGSCHRDGVVAASHAIGVAIRRLARGEQAAGNSILADVLSVAGLCATRDVAAWSPVVAEVKVLMDLSLQFGEAVVAGNAV
jgi:hypothetical protein